MGRRAPSRLYAALRSMPPGVLIEITHSLQHRRGLLEFTRRKELDRDRPPVGRPFDEEIEHTGFRLHRLEQCVGGGEESLGVDGSPVAHGRISSSKAAVAG